MKMAEAQVERPLPSHPATPAGLQAFGARSRVPPIAGIVGVTWRKSESVAPRRDAQPEDRPIDVREITDDLIGLENLTIAQTDAAHFVDAISRDALWGRRQRASVFEQRDLATLEDISKRAGFQRIANGRCSRLVLK